MTDPPCTWVDVLEAEYRALSDSDRAIGPGSGPQPPSGGPGAKADERLRDLHARMHRHAPTALCLSGGGVRSATFGLGVLQGLSHLGLLHRFDYLSTVSGGGYIGGWFTTWLHRSGAAGRDAVLRELAPEHASGPAGPHESSPVERVRRTCRYLAPRGGIVSADVWSLVTTMARNLLLNWLVILPLLAAAILVPHLYYGIVHVIEQNTITSGPCLTVSSSPIWFLLVTSVGAIVSTAYVVLNLVGHGGSWSQGRFLTAFLAPALLAAVSFTLFWSAYPCELKLGNAILLCAAAPASLWLVLGAIPRAWRRRNAQDGSALHVRAGLRTIVASLTAGPVLGAGVYWLATYQFGFGNELREFYAVFAVPIVLALTLATMMIFAGFASYELDDAALEWWSRCGGWLAIAASLWLVAGVLVFYMADVIEASLRAASSALAVNHHALSGAFALVVPLLSSLAGLQARSASADARPSAVVVLLQRIALPATIFVLLSSIAWANFRLLELLEYHLPIGHPPGAGVGETLILGVALLVLGLGMSRFVPVNRFSLHGMYRQRLVRTFLGASRPDRTPNQFTGFDANDDLCVHELQDVRPLHVINATLNAVSSTDVGRHEAEAESFTFTPLHAGNRTVGYRLASEYGSDGGKRASGLSLGLALAVSGAAASPAMGMYSSKARAFLLTLANARLGLWFGNPRDAAAWQRTDPRLGIGPLLRELLGLTTDHNPYVYLSDGGHYENLGLWEMVARRCHYIVVSDAGCDPGYTFDDLSNAVRRIRLDLGVPIQFPPLPFTAAGQGSSNPHFVVGHIDYGAVDGPDAPNGTIVYIKATLSGDEPVDVVNFARADPAFPHDSTSNQFFDEARFESYRALGFHSVVSAAGALAPLAQVEIGRGRAPSFS